MSKFVKRIAFIASLAASALGGNAANAGSAHLGNASEEGVGAEWTPGAAIVTTCALTGSSAFRFPLVVCQTAAGNDSGYVTTDLFKKNGQVYTIQTPLFRTNDAGETRKMRDEKIGSLKARGYSLLVKKDRDNHGSHFIAKSGDVPGLPPKCGTTVHPSRRLRAQGCDYTRSPGV